MTTDEQLKLWVKGESVHNEEEGICCPDFSCCNKDMNTPIKDKKLFYDASINNREDIVMYYCGEFLRKAIELHYRKINKGTDVETEVLIITPNNPEMN